MEYLAHHGTKGMKWGVRKYQNSDGSLTPEGKQRYLKKADIYRRASEVYKNDSAAWRAGRSGSVIGSGALSGASAALAAGSLGLAAGPAIAFVAASAAVPAGMAYLSVSLTAKVEDHISKSYDKKYENIMKELEER